MTKHWIELYSNISGQALEVLRDVSLSYPVAVSNFLRERFERGDYSLQAMRQFLPDVNEMIDFSGYVADPTGEANLHPEKSILQTYENRLALVLTNKCLVYCRFCFRKAFVGQPGDENAIDFDDLLKATEYLRQHEKIEDVLLSGGDPLALPNKTLIPFLKNILKLSHIKTIRIHSRALSVAPKRIDDSLLDLFRSDDRFWYYAHMNHPDDVDHQDVLLATRRLQSARVPVLNQAVILGGVNDDPKVMRELMMKCYENKIIPYNLYVLDKVKGAGHFAVNNEKILAIYKEISRLPGPAQPVLVYVDKDSKKHRAVYDNDFELLNFLGKRE